MSGLQGAFAIFETTPLPANEEPRPEEIKRTRPNSYCKLMAEPGLEPKYFVFQSGALLGVIFLALMLYEKVSVCDFLS